MPADTIRVSIHELAPSIAEITAAGGTVEMTVAGNSMKPTLLNRESTVRLTAITEPKRGDMVLYRRDSGVYVLHRVVKVCGDGSCVFCGDAQYQPETGIRRDQMLAVVCAFCRRRRWISCDDPRYRCWWRLCVGLRGWRRVSAAVKRRLRRLF